MGIEIERKFLVIKALWDAEDKPAGAYYEQGYIGNLPGKTIRVRLTPESGYLTLKGPAEGISRSEFEYPVPPEDARILLDNFCDSHVAKIRTHIEKMGKRWEVDEFLKENQGLIVAEIELEDEEEVFDRPAWVGEEVTHDPRYSNASLSRKPFNSW